MNLGKGLKMALKIMVVDDSAFMRQVISRMIQENPEMNVVATARDGVDALMKIEIFRPDVITLDMEMPGMNGLECLTQVMEKFSLPVIMVSSLTVEGADPTLRALELGAVDFVAKPTSPEPQLLEALKEDLIQKLKVAGSVGAAKLKNVSASYLSRTPFLPVMESNGGSKGKNLEVLAIGSSTGGPKALYHLLPQFPEQFPLGILIAQHMPKDFTAVFAKRLDSLCRIRVAEAKDGDLLEPGTAFLAPSGWQSSVRRDHDGRLRIVVTEEPRLLYKPSVDYLFKSLAMVSQGNVLSVILTGMGGDGAAGMKMLRDQGARTIAQSEKSCVVFGMPRVAIEMGAVEFIEDLAVIFERIMAIVTGSDEVKRG